MRAYDIAAYTYAADTYCDACIAEVMPVSDDEAFDDWDTERALDRLAELRGIDRYAEETFDSGDFPKVVFASQIEDVEHCGNCGCEL